MRILAIGRTGQLATSLAEKVAENPDVELIFLGRPDFDVENTTLTEERIAAQRPDLVINTAAYTTVDKAETEPERAFAINRDGAAAVARAAKILGVPIIHISTDYVFDGSKTQPYVEIDCAAPLNVYGQSKLEGEHAVLEAHPQALILRTSWVFSPFGNNFLKTMLKLGSERSILRVVNDQVGNPTSALDLAAAILRISCQLPGEPGGLYHVTNEGSTTWHGFADFIFRESGKHGDTPPMLEAIASADYRTAAIRPANSQLDCSAFTNRFGVKLRPWTEAAAEAIASCVSHSRAGM